MESKNQCKKKKQKKNKFKNAITTTVLKILNQIKWRKLR